MTTKEAAMHWSVSERTVQRYCEQQIEMGRDKKARKDKSGWLIPDDAICPYVPKGKRPYRDEACYRHVFAAISRGQFISEKLLAVSRDRLKAYIEVLCKAGYIAPVGAPDDGDTAGFIATPDGMHWEKSAFPPIPQKIINSIVMPAVEAGTKAIIQVAIDNS